MLGAPDVTAGHSCCMVDAARLGNPAKDYLQVAFVLPGHRGVWYPPRLPPRESMSLGTISGASQRFFVDANGFRFGKADCLWSAIEIECKLNV